MKLETFFDNFALLTDAPNADARLQEIILQLAGSAPTWSEIVRDFKTSSARRINQLRKAKGIPVWQRNYYEHIIRNENSLQFVEGGFIGWRRSRLRHYNNQQKQIFLRV